jgi:uncharacterized lipoprotein NlpE involved in copper resistance
MKKVIGILALVFTLMACGNNSSQRGVDNDGLKAGDTNGGLADTAYKTDPTGTDSSKGEDREDISKRDTFKNLNTKPKK